MAEIEQKTTAIKKKFDENKLSATDLANFKFVKTRIEELKQTRQDVHGINIENIWEDADKNYIPHRLGTTGKRVVATDEEKGWRGSTVTLGSSNWQSDISQPNPFIKIQIALAILVDQNPSGVFLPALTITSANIVSYTHSISRLWYHRN